MPSRIPSVGDEPLPVHPLPLPVRHGSRRSGPALWVHEADRLLRRLSGGDRIMLNTLRIAAVPLLLGGLLVLWAAIF